MAVGWMTNVAEADTYFTTRLESAPWTALTTSDKTAALTTAYDRLRYCDEFSIPTSPTAAQLAQLKDAQCEVAIYMAIHLGDEDRRKGLQAQGVVGAGVVKETYDKDWLNNLPIPQIVYHILDEFRKYKSPLYMVGVDRDEDKSVDEDVVDV